MKGYEEHMKKHEFRSNLRSEGFSEPLNKYGPDYDYFRHQTEDNKNEYIQFRPGASDTYWEKKEVEEYYSLPKHQRAFLNLKRVMNFFADLHVLLLLLLGLTFYHSTQRASSLNLKEYYASQR